MGQYFSFHEVFPIIEKVITDYSRRSGGYMTHGDIARAMIEDAEARRVLNRLPIQHSVSWWATNMVAWFSQSITVARPELRDRFERKKIGGQWAYKLGSRELNALASERTAIAS